MQVFYLYDTFTHNRYTFILISHPNFKQASLLIFVTSFVLSDNKYLDLNWKDLDKSLCHWKFLLGTPPPTLTC